MKLSRTKKILIIIVVLVAILIAIIVYIAKNGKETSILNKEKDTTDNTIIQNTTVNQNVITNDNSIPEDYVEYIGDTWKELNKISKEEIKLEEDDSIYTYFLMKQCLETYYNPENTTKAVNIIDNEAKNFLGITENNVTEFYSNKAGVSFCIDRIFKQRTNPEDSSQSLYVVYHRIGIGNSKSDTVVFVKIEERTVCFSVYPYEYLQRNNYLSLKENDVINVNNNEISPNADNGYRSNDFSVSAWGQTVELYDRYKFDIQFDLSGLYNKLDEEYKKNKFSSYEDFISYINNKKQQELDQKPEKYLVTDKAGDIREFIMLCGNDNYYTVTAKNLVDYTMILDDYSVLSYRQDLNYKSSLPAAQVRYCIGRVIKAINDKNYEFIYKKLNPVQKNNYYRNYDDFKNYIINEFYNVNDYVIEKMDVMVSDNVYQYLIIVTDAENEDSLNYKKFFMTVKLKDDDDFYISITK